MSIASSSWTSNGEQLDEIAVAPNPTAFASDGRSLWVTGLAKNTVSRIVAD